MAAPAQKQLAPPPETAAEERRRINAQRSRDYRKRRKQLIAEAKEILARGRGVADHTPVLIPSEKPPDPEAIYPPMPGSPNAAPRARKFGRTSPIPESGNPHRYKAHLPGPVGIIPNEPEEERPPPTEADEEGAAKFAAGVGLLVTMAMSDAVARYGTNLPPEIAAMGVDMTDATAVVRTFVMSRAHRVALKYGISLSIPFEDEVVTIGAIGASSYYLWAKFSGALKDAEEKPAQAETAAEDEPDDPGAKTKPADEVDPAGLPAWFGAT